MRREEWLTVHDVATEYKTHPSTVLRIIEHGDVEAYRVGRQWRIAASSWLAYLQRRRGGGAREAS
jgi:excisionase family DNA binding protein